jgi:hypothetical protein
LVRWGLTLLCVFRVGMRERGDCHAREPWIRAAMRTGWMLQRRGSGWSVRVLVGMSLAESWFGGREEGSDGLDFYAVLGQQVLVLEDLEEDDIAVEGR